MSNPSSVDLRTAARLLQHFEHSVMALPTPTLTPPDEGIRRDAVRGLDGEIGEEVDQLRRGERDDVMQNTRLSGLDSLLALPASSRAVPAADAGVRGPEDRRGRIEEDRMSEPAITLDPHGEAMLDLLAGRYDGSFCYVRDDGFAAPLDIAVRFAGQEEFTPLEKQACAWASGRVLDLGCGSGKHLDALRANGLTCVGVDNSPVVRELWRRRGLRGVAAMDAFALACGGGTFDTLTLFANGLSMGATPEGVRRLLGGLARVIGPAGRVVVTNVDVERSTAEHDRLYHAANRAAGRPPGQMVLRSRYRGVTGPPFGWLLMSPDELAAAAGPTGWAVAEVRTADRGGYCARLEKA
jgi:SAM-dependent methyltransferase